MSIHRVQGVQGIAVSLFAAAGGLDVGAERAGYEVRAAVEWERDAAATMEKNFDRLVSPVICKDILDESQLGNSVPPLLAEKVVGAFRAPD